MEVLHFSDQMNNRERDRILMDPRIRRALRKLGKSSVDDDEDDLF